MQCTDVVRPCTVPLTEALGGMPGRSGNPSPWLTHPGPALGGADLGDPVSVDQGLYYLAVLDVRTGSPMRLATDEEAEELSRLLEISGSGHLLRSSSGSCEVGLASARSGGLCGRGSCGWRGGGPCDHCGATESPQWRRGPPMKSVLCNACGTRYRRTGQLGPPGPATSMRKARSVMSDQKRYNVGGKEGSRLVFCEAA